MGATCVMSVEVQLSAGTWTALDADLLAVEGLRIGYGILGTSSADCVASSGLCDFTLRNDAGNSGGIQGWYSPGHTSARGGWTFGIPLRVVFWTGTTSSVTSITRVSSTATVMTSTPHGLSTGMWVTIAGADQSAYNGTVQITYVDADEFRYTVAGSPASPATGVITWIRAYVKFRGKVHTVEPEAGKYSTQRARVFAYDGMRDLAEADIREVTLQINKTEAQLLAAIVAALPVTAQPAATAFDVAIDSYPWAFDDLGPETKALSLIQNVAQSAFALVAMKGDGTLFSLSRHSRATTASSGSLTETMVGLEVQTSLDDVANRVRVTVHPLSVDSAATTVLYALSGNVPVLAAGTTLTLWGAYRDPNDVTRYIGGTAIVDPLVATTDYTANAQADGGGANMTATTSVSIVPFASSCKFTITNNAATPCYLTKVQVRGKGVYDNGPQTLETYSAQTYGDRPLMLDMPYQDDVLIGQSAAEYLYGQRSALIANPISITLIANSSAALMSQVLAREPGDMVTITETMTGQTAVRVIIHAVELDVTQGPWVVCRWTVAPGNPWSVWQIGVAGASEIGATTVLGF